MHELGEALIIESYKVPWLIWIQLLVTILLLFLLFFGFNIFSSDPSSNPTSAASSSTDGSLFASNQSHGNNPLLNPSSSSHETKMEGIQGIRRDTGRSTTGQIMRREEVHEGEESSRKDVTLSRLFGRPRHPCHYFGLAKIAVLKCLGLDSSSESSGDGKHLKEE